MISRNGSLMSQCQRIQYDSPNEWKTKVCEAEQLQHYMAIKKYELNWLSYLKLEPSDTFLPIATIAGLFVEIFG